MSKLGHLDRIDAVEFAHYLCLAGGETNPTLGWTNWFAPIHAVPNTYQLLQEQPTALSEVDRAAGGPCQSRPPDVRAKLNDIGTGNSLQGDRP